MGILGDTLKEIAENKAGIIKPGCKVISAPQEPEVCDVIKKYAEKKNCPVIFVQPDQIQVIKESYKEQAFDYREMKILRYISQENISLAMPRLHAKQHRHYRFRKRRSEKDWGKQSGSDD